MLMKKRTTNNWNENSKFDIRKADIRISSNPRMLECSNPRISSQKVFFISLGCPKNLTDTEVLMGKLVTAGYEIANNPAQANIIIVNTCAFLKSAREEAFATIREMAAWKKKGKCKKLYIA